MHKHRRKLLSLFLSIYIYVCINECYLCYQEPTGISDFRNIYCGQWRTIVESSRYFLFWNIDTLFNELHIVHLLKPGISPTFPGWTEVTLLPSSVFPLTESVLSLIKFPFFFCATVSHFREWSCQSGHVYYSMYSSHSLTCWLLKNDF